MGNGGWGSKTPVLGFIPPSIFFLLYSDLFIPFIPFILVRLPSARDRFVLGSARDDRKVVIARSGEGDEWDVAIPAEAGKPLRLLSVAHEIATLRYPLAMTGFSR